MVAKALFIPRETNHVFVYKPYQGILFINSSGSLLDERPYVNVITLALSHTFPNSSIVLVLPSV